MKLFTSDEPIRKKIWQVREVGTGRHGVCPRRTSDVGGLGGFGGPPAKRLVNICGPCASFTKNTITAPSLYGHFGQGCIHCRVDFDLVSRAGNSRSGEHLWTRPPTWCVSLWRVNFRRAWRRAIES